MGGGSGDGAGEVDPDGRVALGLPPVPVPLRAMTLTDRIDGSLRILRLAPATVLSLTVLAVVPTQLVGSAVVSKGGEVRAGWEMVLGPGAVSLLVDDTASVGMALVLLAIESLALSFVAAGVSALIAAWYAGTRPSTAEILVSAARRLPVLAVVWLLVHATMAAFAVAFVVPALVPMAWFAVSAPVVGVETVGPVQALRRSYRLTRRTIAPVLATMLVAAGVDLFLHVFLGVLVLFGGTPTGGGAVLAAAVGVAIDLVTVPFVAGVAALQYVDLRVRVEGVDIELAALERFTRA